MKAFSCVQSQTCLTDELLLKIKLLKPSFILCSAGNSNLYVCISTSFLFVAFYTFMNKELNFRMRMLDYIIPCMKCLEWIYLHFLKNALPRGTEIIEKIQYK